jgi:protein-tyrosine phosphatase
MTGLVDLHCHVLAGVDDGPQDLEAAVALVQGLEQLGFSELYPTPHQMQSAWTPTPEQTDQAADELRQELSRRGCRAVVHPPAGENMWDSLFQQRREEGNAFPTYPGGKAFLLEFDIQQGPPSQLKEQFFELRLQGLLPVVAHVERYPTLTSRPELMEELGTGAALLLNLSSLASRWWGRTARRLVKLGLVHAVASDGHNSVDIEGCRKGINWLRSRLGQEALDRLLVDNPIRIVAGELPLL